MRKILAIALLLTLCGGALAEGVPGNRLGLELLADLSDGTQNVFISPLSLGYALSLAALGAGGDTWNELLDALDADDSTNLTALNEALDAAGVRWANAAFVRPGTKLNGDYIEAIGQYYDAECFPLDSAERVNQWVSEQTDGLIDSLVDRVPQELRLMLINALAMDAEWAAPFPFTSTVEKTFHAPDGDVQVEFMNQKIFFDYGDRDNTQFIRKEYADSSLAMLIALPPEGGLSQALDELSAKGLDWFEFKDEPVKVRFSLPKFDLSLSNDLTKPLNNAGLKLPFSDQADFSGISDEALFISEVLQKVRIQVDEEGTRAAAVTEVAIASGMSMFEEKPVEMIVDHPFIVVIADEASGAILFAGAVTNPA